MDDVTVPSRTGSRRQQLFVGLLSVLGVVLPALVWILFLGGSDNNYVQYKIKTEQKSSLLPSSENATVLSLTDKEAIAKLEATASPSIVLSSSTSIPTTILPTTISPTSSSPTPLIMGSDQTITSKVIIRGKSYHNLLSMNSARLEEELESLLPLPTPVIVVGMPKAGTSSITEFFRQAFSTQDVSHWKVPEKETYIGICLVQSWNESRLSSKPPTALRDCGNYKVWGQLDVATSPQDCYFPQITHLQQIHDEFPNATIILNQRNVTKWYSSVKRWQAGTELGSLAERLGNCSVGPASTHEQDHVLWYRKQIVRVRQFVEHHPSHALVELDIEDPLAGQILSKAFHTSAKYWTQANHNVKNPNRKTL